MVRVLLRAVRVDLQSNTPVLLLQETEGEGRTLPIFIGSPEATAIAYALQGVTMPRPLTHDLMKDMFEENESLRENGVETALVTYPEEGHGIRKFPALIDYTARIVSWFEHWMPLPGVQSPPNPPTDVF